jgi:hypothetical protein
MPKSQPSVLSSIPASSDTVELGGAANEAVSNNVLVHKKLKTPKIPLSLVENFLAFVLLCIRQFIRGQLVNETMMLCQNLFPDIDN